MKVLIAGGGPTGLTLAIELARRNVEVRIVDKATEFFAGSRGDGLQPRTMEVFEDLGVLDAVLAEGMLPAPFRVHLNGRFVEERWMAPLQEPRPDVPYPNAYFLGQSQTEAILRDRLAEFGVRVELNTALAGFEQDVDGVTATLSTGEVVRAAYLVGADGGRSFVRKALGIAFEGTTDESFRMLLGDVAADLDPACGYWFASEDDPMSGVMMSPLPGQGLFQFGTPLGEEDTDPTLETLQAKLDERQAGVRLEKLTWSTVWRPNVRLAERFRVGRVFLAGDAAHVHPPTGGQGLNTGVQDAYNLGWKLADGAPELLDSYETERRAVAERVLGVSTELMQRYADGDESAHERGEETQQLNISYRTTDGKLVAGDRAPDAPVTAADGTPTRLFDLFRGPHATRLVFGASAPAEPHAYAVLRPGQTASGAYVVDTDGHAFAAYDASDGTDVLVRPDGYLSSRAERR
ncbi:2-polyprenyl-6-methoxyphenol hydroxylase-like FAD-dependent oxidoreductase [Amycolatopsis bartoniae]|uniref:3-(3-hydroxyphenyl)propionate hydroxylase n=1 Tax=Amycolatopsis bartoniae TaxID=941986 RepID=A0A8H9IX41_9PSEU|nr:FAD-dependent monooxygenase [Amycolatopsis bartoniae]MBB2937282.1 2-polyprenyl-6-methoxyphenol hydroxylase-like FAD-dependent oxidoreductase [Amycolatopsis bartoniae]TVT07924.1 3-(3-hydroxyphenyl)propionate hydroxylase [Amycolatopsis bartoniae]GHF77875.1 3-(3-hydroxyphenyl)propionate hydroxylase [Amycolatopsis bartoniae]